MHDKAPVIQGYCPFFLMFVIARYTAFWPDISSGNCTLILVYFLIPGFTFSIT